MSGQTIQIGATGEVLGLQMKKGRGTDLRKLGPASIERVSEIVWDEDCQAWCVRLLQGELSGQHITYELVREYNLWQSSEVSGALVLSNGWFDFGQISGPFYYSDYDVAVDLEVAVIQWMIANGHAKKVIDE